MPDADGSYFLKTKTYRLSHIQKRRRVKRRGGEPAVDDGERLSASSLTYEGIDIKNGTTKEEQIHNERYFMF